MEPVPPARGPGRVIILNGASSSGKSTLAKALQDTLDEPFLHLSSDHLVDAGVLPRRRDDIGPFNWWHEMRPRFFAGFHRCLPAHQIPPEPVGRGRSETSTKLTTWGTS